MTRKLSETLDWRLLSGHNDAARIGTLEFYGGHLTLPGSEVDSREDSPSTRFLSVVNGQRRLLSAVDQPRLKLFEGQLAVAEGPLPAAPAVALPSIGAYTIKGSAAASSNSTDAITTQATGSVFVICLTYGEAAAAANVLVSDNKSNTYTKISASLNYANGSYGCRSEIWFSASAFGGGQPVGGMNHIFTVASEVTETAYYTIAVVELKGSGGITVQDQVGVTDSASPFESGLLTSTTANSIAIGFIGANLNGTGGNFVAQNGFTLLGQVTNSDLYYPGAFSYKQLPLSGDSANSGFTTPGASPASSGNHLVVFTDGSSGVGLPPIG